MGKSCLARCPRPSQCTFESCLSSPCITFPPSLAPPPTPTNRRHSNLYIRRKALQGSSFGGNGFGAPSEDESYVTTNSQRSGLPHSISLGMRSVQGLGSPQPSVFEAGEEAAAALANRGRGRSFTNFRMSFDPSPHRAPSPLPLAASRQNSFIAGVLPPGISETELAGLSGPGGRSIRKVVPRPLAQQRTSVSTGVELAPRSGVLRSSKSMGPGVGQAPAAGGFSLFPGVCWGGGGVWTLGWGCDWLGHEGSPMPLTAFGSRGLCGHVVL